MKPVNLRLARKRLQRRKAREAGDRNAALHGIGKGARKLAERENLKVERDWRGHLREDASLDPSSTPKNLRQDDD